MYCRAHKTATLTSIQHTVPGLPIATAFVRYIILYPKLETPQLILP